MDAFLDIISVMSNAELYTIVSIANKAYRVGHPIMTDNVYDTFVEQLRTMCPDHEYFDKPEPEILKGRQGVQHRLPMLSMVKVYDLDGFKKYVNKVIKVGGKLGVSPTDVLFTIKHKFDGVAAYYDGEMLLTRGTGTHGFDISDMIKKGLCVSGWSVFSSQTDRLGEIVMSKSYFDKHWPDKNTHPRSVVVGAVSAFDLSDELVAAFRNKAIRLMRYADSPRLVVLGVDLLEAHSLESIYANLPAVDYPTDGIVCSVVHQGIAEALGSTKAVHNYHIAIKFYTDVVGTTIRDIQWFIGKSGRETPVALIAPVELSGATISRVNLYNKQYIDKHNIVIGSKIEITRKGGVIPTITKVIEKELEHV